MNLPVPQVFKELDNGDFLVFYQDQPGVLVTRTREQLENRLAQLKKEAA